MPPEEEKEEVMTERACDSTKAAATIHAALLAFQQEVEAIPKSRTATIETTNGTSYSYHYADLADIMAVIRPLLVKHGLAVTQDVQGDGERVGVSTTLIHKSGQTLASSVLWLKTSGKARDAGAAVTYARRYSLSALLGLVTEDDDENVLGHVEHRMTHEAREMSPRQRQLIAEMVHERGLTSDEVLALASRVAGRDISALSELTGGEGGEVSRFIAALKEIPRQKRAAGDQEW